MGDCRNLVTGAAQGTWDAISAPGRSWSDSTMTYGDVAETAGLVSLPAVAGKYDPLQLNAGPVKAWHGSNTPNIKTLKASEPGTGAMGPGVYFTPVPNLAERYGPNLYEKDLEGFFGGMGRLDSDADINHFQTWRDETARLLDAATDAERPIIEKSLERGLTSGDGYPFFIDIAAGLGSKESAQDVFRRAGFKGVSGHIDGPEIVMFDDVAMQPSIRAYHGSPHDFDRFDMSKIGTGEGAQAYGYGLYFAEAEDVAKSYRSHNSGNAKFTYNGKPITDELKQSVAWYLDQNGGDKQAVIDQWRGMYRPEYFDGPTGKKEMKILEQMDYGKLKPGRMYEVAIAADPADFLDWDAPLSEQPAKVRDWADKVAGSSYIGRKRLEDSGATGRDVWEKSRSPFVARGAGYDEWAGGGPSRAMSEAGIPGIKYYDQGSRAGKEGTRNYVVFDDSLIEILRKYGLAGAAPLGAILGTQDDEKQRIRDFLSQ